MPNQPSADSICFYTDSTYFSGAEKSFAILAETMASRGINVSLLCTPHTSQRFAATAPKAVISADVTRSKISLRWYLSLKRRLKRDKPRVLLINMWSPYANTLALMAARSAGIPAIGIYHYYQERHQVKGILRLMGYRFGERRMARVLTVSEAHRAVLADQFGFPKEKIGVLLNGVSAPAKQPAFKDNEPRRLLTVGSLEPAKGYDFLISVLSHVKTPLALTVVGDGPERERLERLARTSPHPIAFEGLQKDTAPYYETHDVLAHPSHFENLSMAILESMAFGMTSIANNVGGNRELVNDKTGWLLKLGDEDAWAKALEEACSTPLESRKRAAHDSWKANFTDERQCDSLLAHIQPLLNAS